MAFSSNPFPAPFREPLSWYGACLSTVDIIIILADSVPSSESTVTGHDDASVCRKTEQVVGSIQVQNSTASLTLPTSPGHSSLTLPTSPGHSSAPCQKNSPPLNNKYQSMKECEGMH